MADLGQRGHPAGSDPYHAPPVAAGWAGMALFGAMLLIMMGSFQAIVGLVALLDDSYYAVRPSGLVVDVDYTVWGWVHLVIGLVALAAGIGLTSGATWARVLGITVAVCSAVVNFAFVAAYPFWSVLVIAIDVLVIYAIASHGGELRHKI
jgi:hypothetical protein